MTDDSDNFGSRMVRIKREKGIPVAGPGRKPIAEKFRTQIAATEQAFAKSMPREAKRFVDELAPQQAEECPAHHAILCCPECGYQSKRRAYNHQAAQYVFDRIMGRPTSRSENTVTVKLVEQLTTAVVALFLEVNGIDEPNARQAAFAERLTSLGSLYGGGAA